MAAETRLDEARRYMKIAEQIKNGSRYPDNSETWLYRAAGTLMIGFRASISFEVVQITVNIAVDQPGPRGYD